MQFTLTSLLLAIASLGCFAATIAHSALGERYFVPQIQAQTEWPGSAKSNELRKQIVRLAWHATSVVWAGFGAMFLALLFGWPPLRAVYVVSAATFAVLFIMTGPMTSWRHVGWPVFAAITASLAGIVAITS